MAHQITEKVVGEVAQQELVLVLKVVAQQVE
jgi:hypothetical protein